VFIRVERSNLMLDFIDLCR